MKSKLLLTAAVLSAGSIISARAGTKDDVKGAIKKLAENGNYSWTSTTQRPERPDGDGGNTNRFRSGPTEGKTADGMIHVKRSRGDRSYESVSKGDKVARKGEDGWAVIEPRPATDAGGDDGQRRRGSGRGSSMRNYRPPTARADELLAGVGELKKDGDAYVGELTEEGARALVSFGRGRGRGGDGGDAPERPQPTGVKGTAKFWVKDGVLTKYESVVAGKMKFGEREFDLGRTTSVEIKEVGSTKIDVPDDIKAKLSAEEKPAEEAKAEEK
jgi:hypothetical protein